jgi:hypothetical protein
MKKIISSLIVASGLLFANNQVELNINSNTLEAVGDIYLNDTYNVSNDANYYITASYLGSEKHNDTTKIISGGLKIMSPFSNDNGLAFGLGINAVFADDISDKTFMAVPLTFYTKYEFDEYIFFNLKYGYAPKTLSFADANRYKDFKITANYKVLDNGYVFLGKRDIRTSYSSNSIADVKYDTDIFFGFKVEF